jgi:alpha-L-rhamnosidase
MSIHPKHFFFLLFLLLLAISACIPAHTRSHAPKFYPNSKPATRWWWFATEIKNADIKYQLDWAKENNFGGVEVAWVYPLYRYQDMYARKYNRFYPKDTTSQKWLSPGWADAVTYTKRYADSIGLACDFTFGSAWPVAGSNIAKEYTTQVYGDTAFRQTLTFAWEWPKIPLVINHLDSNAFRIFAEPIGAALKEPLRGSKSALFTDSWEIKLNDKLKVWTQGFDKTFQAKFGYDILPYMQQGIDSFPDVRYDYMMHLGDLVLDNFFKPYVRKCRALGAWSRVQCLGAPTDVMTAYAQVDIPETECMLNNPSYSKIVSSAAALAGKRMVSSETFTCMYGFPSTYLRQEQTADLKMVVDAMFAQGVNHHFYHGMPYNPKGSDTCTFFATTYFGPGGSLSPELPAFNDYVGRVSGLLEQGRTYADVAVYLPYEDAVMQGAYPQERRRVWVWGEYEMRYLVMPEELEGYHPLYINRTFLEQAQYEKGKLRVGDAQFSSLYIDVDWMDARALKRVVELAHEGLPICLKKSPQEPGKTKSGDYDALLAQLIALPNVKQDFGQVIDHKPLIAGDSIPAYWCRVLPDGTHYIFLAQPLSKDLTYPVYCGQSLMNQSEFKELTLQVNGKTIHQNFEFKPYQSLLLKISRRGKLEFVDIDFVPKTPIVRPREVQKSYF